MEAFIEAAQEGDLEAIKKYTASDCFEFFEDLVLLTAVKNKRAEVCFYLLDCVTKIDNDTKSRIVELALESKIELVDKLIEKKIGLEQVLIHYVKKGDLDKVKELNSLFGDLIRGNLRIEAFVVAAETGNLELVKFFFEDCSENEIDYDLNFQQMFSFDVYSHCHVMEYLIFHNKTPLDVKFYVSFLDGKTDPELLKCIIQHGVKENMYQQIRDSLYCKKSKDLVDEIYFSWNKKS